MVLFESEEISAFESSFDGLAEQFHIIDKVGEGTFSCVYRGHDLVANSVVAVKKIHATSSPQRIKNELEILAALHSSNDVVSSVVTAMRSRDQVIVVMPYVEFTDFRTMYTDCSLPEVRTYMAQLLIALDFTASRKVIHRDVKPTNFLYNRDTQKGTLVDFGLAEFVSLGECTCSSKSMETDYHALPAAVLEGGYRKDDKRPSRRANRAGTRGFRAPEVLLKCGRQSPKVDVWAAGVVLLMMLARRFPFFTSMDDADALVEMASIYGRREMRAVAHLHGAEFETNLLTIADQRHTWMQIVLWSNKQEHKSQEWNDAIDLLDRLMELDSTKRISAAAALEHKFFTSY